MDRDSKNDSIREMEQIRKGLEEFLNQEVLNQPSAAQENTTFNNAAQKNIISGNVAQKNITFNNAAQKNITSSNVAQKNITSGNAVQKNITSNNMAQEEHFRQKRLYQNHLEEQELYFDDLDFADSNQVNASSNAVNIIEQGTEDVNHEIRRMRTEPQFFTLGEEEEEEKEIDIIKATGRKGSTQVRSSREDDYAEDYVEDWDSKDYRRRVLEQADAPINGGRKQQSDKQSQNRVCEKAGKMSTQKQIKTDRSVARNNRSKGEDEEEMQDSSHKTKKTRKKKKSKFKRFLVTVALLVVLVGAGLYYLVGAVYAKMNYVGIDSVATAPMKEDGVTNILLIGNDSRENGEDGRSDAMILLSISDKTKKIYMTSLLRDMYVEIPGYKGNRLNAAYSYGGAELLMDTIEQNLDITINRYVLVNFEAFAKLVDAVGGIELELTSKEIEYVNAYLVEYNMLTERPQGTDNMDTSVSGMVHLNGAQALAYSRNRYLGTDFGRTERQRKVLAAVIDKAPKALVSNPKELLNGLLPNLTTNLTKNETFQFSLMAPKMLTYEIVQNSIPIEGTYQNATIRDMAVLEVDFEANKQYLRENVYGEGVAVTVTE